jgi:hypothetical protein
MVVIHCWWFRNGTMNTTSKLGPDTQTERGTCPGVGLWVYLKRRYTTGPGGERRISAQPFCSGGSEKMVLNPSEVALGPVVARARVFSPTHKRTEGRAPVWGSEFTSKDAALQGGAWNRCYAERKIVRSAWWWLTGGGGILPLFSANPPLHGN